MGQYIGSGLKKQFTQSTGREVTWGEHYWHSFIKCLTGDGFNIYIIFAYRDLFQAVFHHAFYWKKLSVQLNVKPHI